MKKKIAVMAVMLCTALLGTACAGEGELAGLVIGNLLFRIRQLISQTLEGFAYRQYV